MGDGDFMNGYVKVYETPPDYKYSRRSYKKLKLIHEGKNTLLTSGQDVIGLQMLYWDSEVPITPPNLIAVKFGFNQLTLTDTVPSPDESRGAYPISDQYIRTGTTIINVFYVPPEKPEGQPANIDKATLRIKSSFAGGSICEKIISPAISKTEQIGLLFEWAVTLVG